MHQLDPADTTDYVPAAAGLGGGREAVAPQILSWTTVLRRHYNTNSKHSTNNIIDASFVAMSVDAACSMDLTCSESTQANTATSDIGTQCSPTILIRRGSQTEEEYSVETGPHNCFCHLQPGDTGSSGDSEEIQSGEKPYPCLSCQQCNRPTAHGKVGGRGL